MSSWTSTLKDMERRSRQAVGDVSLIIESNEVTDPSTSASSLVLGEARQLDKLDPLDRERIVEERLADLSDTLSIRYRQVCRDLRDDSRLAWTGDAHELRDILANILRTLAPTEEVEAQTWFKLEKDTSGPTHTQRAKYIMIQNQDGMAAKAVSNEIELVDELVSKVVRATYSDGSRLAHSNNATYSDCIRLLLHFDALMFSLLNAASDSTK